MEKKLLLLPTFDGQSRGVAAINMMAIDVIKPSVSAGKTSIFMTGDHNVNYVTVELDMQSLVDKLKSVGIEFIDLSDGRKLASITQHDD